MLDLCLESTSLLAKDEGKSIMSLIDKDTTVLDDKKRQWSRRHCFKALPLRHGVLGLRDISTQEEN